MNRFSKKDFETIFKSFRVPTLSLVEKVRSGPDDVLYLFKAEDGKEYGALIRDYMSELIDEARELKNDCGIEVAEWVELTNHDGDEKFISEYNGDFVAIFLKKM